MSSSNSNIKWRKEDRKKLSNMVRKFNAKLTRELKKNPSKAEYLPQRLSVEGVTKNISSRRDFNNILKSHDRAFNKSAFDLVEGKNGLRTTKWEKKEIGIMVRTINARRKKEMKYVEQPTQPWQLGSIEYNSLKPKKYDVNTLRQKDWGMYKKTVMYQSRSNYQSDKLVKYKQNYIRCVRENLGSSPDAQRLIDIVEGLEASALYYAYYDDPVLQINFTSDPLPADMIVKHAIRGWQKFLGIKQEL